MPPSARMLTADDHQAKRVQSQPGRVQEQSKATMKHILAVRSQTGGKVDKGATVKVTDHVASS